MTKAVVLLSGGLDSVTALYLAKFEQRDVTALFFDYGQRNRARETKAVTEICALEELKVPLRVAPLPSFLFGNNGLTGIPKKLAANRTGDFDADPNSYVPLRNAVFATAATAYAESIGAKEVWLGLIYMPPGKGLSDTSPAFVRALELALELGSKAGREGRRVKLCMPLKHYTKADVLRLALNLGVPFAKTWSCYHNGTTPCGTCDPCVTVNQAIQTTHEVKFR